MIGCAPAADPILLGCGRGSCEFASFRVQTDVEYGTGGRCYNDFDFLPRGTPAVPLTATCVRSSPFVRVYQEDCHGVDCSVACAPGDIMTQCAVLGTGRVNAVRSSQMADLVAVMEQGGDRRYCRQPWEPKYDRRCAYEWTYENDCNGYTTDGLDCNYYRGYYYKTCRYCGWRYSSAWRGYVHSWHGGVYFVTRFPYRLHPPADSTTDKTRGSPHRACISDTAKLVLHFRIDFREGHWYYCRGGRSARYQVVEHQPQCTRRRVWRRMCRDVQVNAPPPEYGIRAMCLASAGEQLLSRGRPATLSGGEYVGNYGRGGRLTLAASNAVDGVSRCAEHQLAHSKYARRGNYLRIDLDGPARVTRVVVHSRSDCARCADRTRGAVVLVQDSPRFDSWRWKNHAACGTLERCVANHPCLTRSMKRKRRAE